MIKGNEDWVAIEMRFCDQGIEMVMFKVTGPFPERDDVFAVYGIKTEADKRAARHTSIVIGEGESARRVAVKQMMGTETAAWLKYVAR